MDVWQRLLSRSPIEWLLGEDNPSVRYMTLRDLLDRDDSGVEARAARKAIPTSRIAATILSKQKEGGFWEKRESPYLPKYKSSYWQVMMLGQLAIESSDVKVRKACEFVFSLQLSEGGFSSQTRQSALGEYEWMRTRTALKERLQPEAGVWAESLVREYQYSCLTGNVCAAMLRLGYNRDARLARALSWLVSVQNTDGGWLCPYWKAHIKDIHSCFYGTICPLEALSEVPVAERSKEIQDAVERGAEFLLKHRLYKADHHGFRVINRNWTKFGFPWFYGYDVLRGLSVLTKLGYTNDDRLADALDLVIQKRRADGTWLLESSPTGRMQASLEPVGKPSKWVTLNALRVLRKLHKTESRQVREVLNEI